MPRLKRRQNLTVRQASTLTQGDAHTEIDAPAEPEVSSDAAAEDVVEERNNEVEDAANATEAAEGEVAEEAAVTETPRRKRKRGTPSATTGNNSQNVNREITMSGMIFMCSTATKKDCFKYGVFGFPEQKKDSVAQVKKGMKLFLYDVDKKHLHGVYEASSRGGMNLVPEAFQWSDRKFPAQVKFRIHKDCMPLAGPAFKEAIKDSSNSGGRFNVELDVAKVRKLMQLFRPLGSEGLPLPTQPRRAQDAQRDPASQHAQRGPEDRHARRGPPQDRHVAGRLPPLEPVLSREPVYSIESASRYSRERLPIHLDYYRTQPSYLPSSQTASYLPPSQIETIEAEAARWRYLDALYLQEPRVGAQRPLPYDPNYRGAEYQREAPYYSNYGVSHSLGFPP